MTPREWASPYGASAYIGLGLALLVLLLLARRIARSPSARRWSLLVLRAGVLATLVFILLNLVSVSEARLPPRAPEVVYLVDCSRSMALDRPLPRLEIVKQAIARSVPLVTANPPPRVSTYRFGESLAATTNLAELAPTDDATRLLEALDRLPSHFADGPPAGVVIFSDGRTSETAGFEEIAAGYRRLGVPLHVFPVGDSVTGDVAIENIIAPREAAPGTTVPVRVVVRSRGYAGQRAEVRIRSQTEPNRPPLATLPITLSDGSQTHELRVDQRTSGLNPEARQLVAEVPLLPGEAVEGNNRVAFTIGARKQKVRVIYMEGTLNNEYHWVRDALVEDPNIECVAMEVNNQYAARQILYRVNDRRRGYPATREELFTYDVVICSDIARSAFTQQQIDWTAELVHKRGGGFAMVGGNTSFGAGFWDQTAWDKLIPVDMSGQANSPGRGTCWNLQFKITIPKAAEDHPVWRIVDDPAKNKQILARMPIFTGSNLVERLKPGAMALGYSDRALPRVGVMPVFACESYGKGRTFAMTTDTTQDWGTFFERDWGEKGDNRYFRKFWRNVVMWLAENSAGANRRLRVETDKVLYRPGEPIQVSARAYDEKLDETKRYRLTTRLRPTGEAASPAALQESTLAPSPSEAVYQGSLTTPSLNQLPAVAKDGGAAPRLATLEVSAHDGDKLAAQAALDVQVLDDPVEYQDPRPDPARLEQLARDSGGTVVHTAEQLAGILNACKTAPGEVVVHKTPLWDHAALWLLLLTLLTADWMLRRWWGLA
jgi:uncharacterized membrane protein